MQLKLTFFEVLVKDGFAAAVRFTQEPLDLVAFDGAFEISLGNGKCDLRRKIHFLIDRHPDYAKRENGKGLSFADQLFKTGASAETFCFPEAVIVEQSHGIASLTRKDPAAAEIPAADGPKP